MYERQELTVEHIARAIGVSRSTTQRALSSTASSTPRQEQLTAAEHA